MVRDWFVAKTLPKVAEGEEANCEDRAVRDESVDDEAKDLEEMRRVTGDLREFIVKEVAGGRWED
jgi:hypothetical protein